MRALKITLWWPAVTVVIAALALVSALLVINYLGSRNARAERKALHSLRTVNAFIRRLLRGLSMTLDDNTVLAVTQPMFDGLYEYYRRAVLLGRPPA